DQLARLALGVADVEGEHAQGHADLRGGEAHAGRVQHRLVEVPHEVAQLKVKVAHRLCGSLQDRVTKQPYWPKHGHPPGKLTVMRRRRLGVSQALPGTPAEYAGARHGTR